MNAEILIGGLIVTVVAVAVALAAGLAVQRFVPVEDRQENNDVAGIAFAIIGVLYAILMTFVIVSVWEAGDGAQDSSRAEARAVVDLNHYADTLPAAEAAAMRELTGEYIHIVEQQEWPAMAGGQPVGRAGSAVISKLWKCVDAPLPDGADAAANRQSEARADLRALTLNRDARLAAADAGLPKVMWLALIVGDVLTLANALMFGVKGSGEYLTIIALLAAMSALMLFAVYELEFPFQRGESVTVDVFTDVVDDGTAR
ncbi:hypothetical protein [Dactylosporangium sp. NPDC050588]|uniref:bestrophin-like domain n=1 Tax=Dactylosporangium sp. NPDC050588 TaxID=3157211 RepID=UPI0033E1A006